MSDDAQAISRATKEELDSAIRYAKKFLEDTLSFLGLNTDIQASHDDDVIQLGIPSTQMNGFLIGQRGETMRAIQFLVSNALKNQGHAWTRVNVDVAGYKQQRASRLEKTAEAWVEQVKTSAEPLALAPMNAADRRIIHKLASEAGLATESAGEGHERHVILKPAS